MDVFTQSTRPPSVKSSDYFENFLGLEATERNDTVIVKFKTDEGKVFTQAYPKQTRIGDVKRKLSDVFSIPTSSMNLTVTDQSTTELSEDKQLQDFDIGPFSTLEFGLHSFDIARKILPDDFYDFKEPDIITVRVEVDYDEYKDVVVEIEDRSIVKPYLGGFVNKRTCEEYHNGYTQTGPPATRVPPQMKFHRDTQTYFVRNRNLETVYERATQMSNEITWIPTVTDKILTAKPYETADEREKRLDVLGKVLTIQRYFRAWKMRKALKALSAEYKKRIQKELELEAYYIRDEEEQRKKELICKVFPRTKYDFQMLYAMVDRWKKAEIKRISNQYCGAAKISQFYTLLDKEVEMLRAIEEHRIIVKKEMQEKKIYEFFKTISTPLSWNSDYKNLFIEMDTLETQRGREFYEIYKAFADRRASREDHIQGLLNVKLTLHDHYCTVAMELIKLIDRACELLVRGLDDRYLEMLQKRIEALYIYHIRMPECNDGVTNRMNRVKEKLMHDNLFYCIRCKKLKTHEQFLIHSRVKRLTICETCTWNDKVIEPWIDLAPARFILRRIRHEERRKSAKSSIAYILQDRDIHHIVHDIWHAKSVISESDDVYDLRLVRFFKDQDWAPWNCILLNTKEAKIHQKIRKLTDCYDEEIFYRVYNKHALARNHFRQAIQLDEENMEFGTYDTKWNELIESKKFVPVNSKVKILLSCH